MTNTERSQKIESYGAAYAKLLASLPQFPRAMWQYRAAPDSWTIHEIVVHIADSEANSYARCRRLIAEPGSTVMAYDEMAWAQRLNYHAQSPETALELFKQLRAASYALIKTLPETTWTHGRVRSGRPGTRGTWLFSESQPNVHRLVDLTE